MSGIFRTATFVSRNLSLPRNSRSTRPVKTSALMQPAKPPIVVNAKGKHTATVIWMHGRAFLPPRPSYMIDSIFILATKSAFSYWPVLRDTLRF